MQRHPQAGRPFVFAGSVLSFTLVSLVHAQPIALSAVAQNAVWQNPVRQNPVAQNAVVGVWVMRYERPMNDARSTGVHSATSDAAEVVQGRLTLRQTGDSVFGEWQTIVAKGDTAPAPRDVHGVQRRDSLFLRFRPVVDNEASLIATAAHEFVEFIKTYVHGMPSTTTAFDVALRGDVLTGTRRTVFMDGTPRGQAQALTGTRAKP